ncbi:uncharacterized protein LOC141666086 [Apium graveolens]|uniref:uncharacterized protein LOC141666086 n=1 Tax=Apium graveolens TaxID=4045 RepID=UPI003D79D8B1
MKDTVTVIKNRLIAAQDRQKKYANPARKDVKFKIGEPVLLKVSPWKVLTLFGKKGKLAPRYIGSFEILNHVGKIAYELALPSQYQYVHNILDRQDRTLRNKLVRLVKVLWRNLKVEEATWELESEMRNRYPQLFS